MTWLWRRSKHPSQGFGHPKNVSAEVPFAYRLIHTRRIHIGTSGWHYAHWRGPFYPPEMRPDQMLNWYSQHFDTVEINNSFYRLPHRMRCEPGASDTSQFLFRNESQPLHHA